jgi:hypothetical protein
MREDPKSELVQSLEALLPTGLVQAGQLGNTFELRQRLRDLECQELCLVIREWFQARPEWSRHFWMLSGADGETDFGLPLDETCAFTDEETEALSVLALGCQNCRGGNVEDFGDAMEGELNGVGWVREMVDPIIARILTEYTQTDGASFLAGVDQAPLQQHTAPSLASSKRSPGL